MTEKTLAAQIKGIEVQLAVLKAQLKRLSTSSPPHSFADLYGILAGKVDSSDSEIDSVQYHFEWEGREER